FAQKPISAITKKDCDQVLHLLEKGCTRVYQRATLKPGAKVYKTMSCPKIAEFCTIKEETVEKSFRGESVSLDSAQQIAKALGQKVETLFEVETDERPVTQKTIDRKSTRLNSSHVSISY